MQRWVKLAIKEAKKSTYYQRVGCIVFNKGKFISKGFNAINRSINKHHPSFRKFSHSIHAEVAAIINARKKLKGMSILIIRIDNYGELRLAKPCKYCMAYIEYVGIRTIYYSTNKGTFERLDAVGGCFCRRGKTR